MCDYIVTEASSILYGNTKVQKLINITKNFYGQISSCDTSH